MRLSEKIKSRRVELGMTQAELCDGGITRNMLSCIENGTAMPSLDTLYFLAERLGVPAGYLLSDEYDIDVYATQNTKAEARRLFAQGKHRECVDILSNLRDDDEIFYMLAYSFNALALEQFGYGSLASAREYFLRSIENADKTIYDTRRLKSSSLLYLAICNNVNLPLLEFDESTYLDGTQGYDDIDLYKYMTADMTHEFKNRQYAMHLEAKRLMKERRIPDALALLTKIEDTRRDYPSNPYLFFSLYADLESCYKMILDFEKAYKYSSKRISLLEGFTG